MIWIRFFDCVLAFWLALSSQVFFYPESIWLLNDRICAAALLLFALCSLLPSLHKAHLLNYLVVFWLLGWNYRHGAPLPFFMQNYQVLALLLSVSSLIPSSPAKSSFY